MTIEKKNITMKVNGKDIKLNPFASNIIFNVILGMTTTLKLDSEPELIEITIKK